MDLHATVRRSRDQIFTKIDDEIVILGLKNQEYFSLNPTASRIWELIEEPKKVQDVLDKLVEEYDVERDQAEADLIDLLGRLAGEGLVQIEE